MHVGNPGQLYGIFPDRWFAGSTARSARPAAGFVHAAADDEYFQPECHAGCAAPVFRAFPQRWRFGICGGIVGPTP